MRRFSPIALWLILSCCALAGCGSGGQQAEPTTPEVGAEQSPPAALEITTIDVGKLPKLGDYLPPLDKSRVEVAPPKGWLVKRNSNDYLCAFAKEKGGVVPAIVVKVSEPITGFSDVKAENVIEFAAAVQGTLQEPLESAIPLVIGKHAFARYVKVASVGGLPAEVQMLVTVHGGRMYSVELRVRPEEIRKYRDSGYAVAAGLKFTVSNKPFEFNPDTTDNPAESPPAETKVE